MPSSCNGTLLIVDDETEFLQVLASIMSESACTIQTASNGKEALAAIKSGAIDAVLSDVNMPDMNGLELLFHVREMNMELPFVFMTGYGDIAKSVEALRLGATDFLEKPFDGKHLIEVMRKAILLGIAQKEVLAETERLYVSSGIPMEERLRLQRMKQSVLMLKKMSKIYGKVS